MVFFFILVDNPTKPMKVLVCEDDMIVVKVIQVALENENIQAVYVRDGRRALEHLREQNFDLIITDIHMPYYNGDDILKLVREEQQKRTPIIMVSSDNEEEVISLALRSGVNEFISKPLDADKLGKTLQKYLSASKSK
jgi:CheY-like chemotaxis protein